MVTTEVRTRERRDVRLERQRQARHPGLFDARAGVVTQRSVRQRDRSWCRVFYYAKRCVATALLLHTPGITSGQEAGAIALTDSASSSRAPAWSPDGRHIAFESHQNGRWSIQVLTVETGAVERLTDSDTDERYPAWSPDGLRLVSVCYRSGQADLCVRRIGRRDPVTVIPAPGEELWPAWSPDGHEIAFTRQLGSAFDLRITRFDETGSHPAVTVVADARWPRWSPDGRRLAFFSRRDTGGSDDEIYTVDRRSGAVSRLTRYPGHDFCPAWSPTTERLVVASVDQDGTRALRILDYQGHEVARLGRGYHRVTEPSWSPDGHSIVYAAARREGHEYQLFLERVAPTAR